MIVIKKMTVLLSYIRLGVDYWEGHVRVAVFLDMQKEMI